MLIRSYDDKAYLCPDTSTGMSSARNHHQWQRGSELGEAVSEELTVNPQKYIDHPALESASVTTGKILSAPFPYILSSVAQDHYYPEKDKLRGVLQEGKRMKSVGNYDFLNVYVPPYQKKLP